jgi:hypothetical protein
MRQKTAPCLDAHQFVERQPPCPRATTIMAGFEAAGVGVLFGGLG